MNHYQDVVVEYLRADRFVFVREECCLQLNEWGHPDGSGRHWYCDALAVHNGEHVAYLCEVTYDKSMGPLLKRLTDWNSDWAKVKAVLVRDFGVKPKSIPDDRKN